MALNSKHSKKRPTIGFSELNRRTYEASPAGRKQRENSMHGSENRSYENSSDNKHQSQSNNSYNGYMGNNNNNSYPYADDNKSHSYYGYSGQHVSSYSRDSQASKYMNAYKKRRSSKKIKIIIAVVVAVIAALSIGAIAFANMISGNINSGMDNIGLTPTKYANEPFYVVLMGIDSSDERKGEGGTDEDFRSDSMILTRVDPVKKKVSLMSLHRDVEVDMGEYGTQKLNAAHSLGGPELVIKSVSDLAGVPINHYAEINFEGFSTVVDNLGGVVVDVPMDIIDEYAGVVFKGEQVLNGENALCLCRSRHSYDDYGDGDKFRAANQRLVLSAIAKKILHSDIITIAKTVTDLSNYIKTDMSLNDIIGLAQMMKDINFEEDVYSAMMPTEGVYKDGVWYEQLDQAKWDTMMKRMDQGLPPSTETIIDDNTGTILAYSGGGSESNDSNSESDGTFSGTVSVKNGTSKDGVAASASAKIAKLGFKTDTGNANTQDYTTTAIVYTNDNQKKGAEAIKDALGCGKVEKNNNEYVYDTDILVVVGTDYQD